MTASCTVAGRLRKYTFSNAPAVKSTTSPITVPKRGAFDFFKGNIDNEMAKGITQLSKPSTAARFHWIMVPPRAEFKPLRTKLLDGSCDVYASMQWPLTCTGRGRFASGHRARASYPDSSLGIGQDITAALLLGQRVRV